MRIVDALPDGVEAIRRKFILGQLLPALIGSDAGVAA